MSNLKVVPVEFIERIKREMPDGTVIASPEWWAPRLYRWAIAAAPAPEQAEVERLKAKNKRSREVLLRVCGCAKCTAELEQTNE